MKEVGQKRGKRLVALLADDSGTIELVWFKGIAWVKKYLKPGQSYLVFGKPSLYKSNLNIVHPEMELFQGEDDNTSISKFQPVYHSTEKLSGKGLDSRGIAKLQRELWKTVGQQIKEFLPEKIIKTFKLIDRKEAYKNIHFPENQEITLENLDEVWDLKDYLDDLSMKKTPKEDFVPGEIIVKFNDETSKNKKFFRACS